MSHWCRSWTKCHSGELEIADRTGSDPRMHFGPLVDCAKYDSAELSHSGCRIALTTLSCGSTEYQLEKHGDEAVA